VTGKTLPELAGIPVTRLNGVGEQAAAALHDVGVDTVFDLLTYYPRRWIDRTREARIADLPPGEEGLIVAEVRQVRTVPSRQRGRKPRVEAVVHDGTASLTITFFNQPWRARQLKAGQNITVWGKLDVFRGVRQMVNPVLDLLGEGDDLGAIVPVYPQSEKAGVTTGEVRRWVKEALRRTGELAEPLPERVLDALDLQSRADAFRHVHAPESLGAAQAGRHRLAFDELLRLQLVLVLRKKAYEREARGIRHRLPEDPSSSLVAQFHASLPFPLTGAQARAIDRIQKDMASPTPMHRLLQGDVGSGKTIVAVSALLTAVQGGWQGALMAPTEVLAEQHLATIRPLVEGLVVTDSGATLFGERNVSVALLTNRTTPKERASLLPRLASGEVDIVVGTHALLTEHVAFNQLGCVVIDEQHRFGVDQRAALREKGRQADPDVLVMTATPIPRTAAMTVFGDLDVTVLDELPPGRTPIETVWARAPMDVEMAWQSVRDEVGEGRQAYVVCPLVDESEKVQAASANVEYERLATEELQGLRLGLLHGQLPSSEKEAVMARFRRREVDVLVATTVIEVGVDVPNATVMVILDADRFGIAQLHQLRGRVGRGADASRCFLLGGTDEAGLASTEHAAERLGAMERTTDGFELAEVDLDLRGEGTILSSRQSGRSDLKLASLKRDKKLVEQAREVAFDLVGPTGRGLDDLSDLKHEVEWLVDPDESDYLFRS
jgi:ATP-dependent DNA helicase RecG